MKRTNRPLGSSVGGMLLACLLATSVGTATYGQGQAEGLEGRVDSTVREMGVLETTRSVDIRCEVRGQATILSLVPAGIMVKKGDLLVELDDSVLQDQLLKHEIEVAQGVAALQLAEAELENANRGSSAMVGVARQSLAVALIEKERVLGDGGSVATELLEVNAKITVAKARLKTAEILRVQARNEGKSVAEAELMAIEARAAISVAEAHKRLLEGAEKQKRTAVCDLAIAIGEREVMLRENERQTSIRSAQAKLAAQIAAKEVAERRVAGVKLQIERCKIHAPRPGLVVYAVSGSGRAGNQVVEEGASVRERQTLIKLPDLSRWQMRVFVNESKVARIRQGQAATIAVDALPGKVYKGTVTHVSNYAEPSSWFARDVKKYAVIVALDEVPQPSKIGLTGLATIQAGKAKQ